MFTVSVNWILDIGDIFESVKYYISTALSLLLWIQTWLCLCSYSAQRTGLVLKD